MRLTRMYTRMDQIIVQKKMKFKQVNVLCNCTNDLWIDAFCFV